MPRWTALHNPALPEERRRLAVEALHWGTALALAVPEATAIQAECDAEYLSRQHGSPEEALRRIQWRPGTGRRPQAQ